MSDQRSANGGGAGGGAERDRQVLLAARQKGKLSTFGAFFRLSGPGWLQGAITLGGASLASSLYLGVLGGFSMLWLQPVAVIAGIVMLSAISYVALSTNEKPFGAINRHINPMLGWSWVIATLIANMVFAMPQFSLGTAAVRQNLLPRLVGPEAMPEGVGKALVCGGILVICIFIVWFYNSGSKGVRFFDIVLKLMVGVIVLCFFGVVVKMSFVKDGLEWGMILKGYIPNFSLLSSPAKTFAPFIEQVDEQFRGFWSAKIVGEQRAVMITAVSAAVGINMTFLMPYSLLKRGWNKDFRGLAIFDLSFGMFIPFILATSCVMIAAASQFHTQPAKGLLDQSVEAPKNMVANYNKNALARIKFEMADDEAFAALSDGQKALRIESLPQADKQMAAMLVRRDAFNLANSLSPLTGPAIAHYAFGIGVVGMGISSIIIMMLINGFVFCEILGVESKGWPYRIGSLMPAVGALGPFLWTGGKAQFWLAVPAFVFGMMILPIAYFTFYLMMNSKSLLGDNMPRGGKRLLWNILMAVASGLASFGAVWSLWNFSVKQFDTGWPGIALPVVFIAVCLLVWFLRRKAGVRK